VSTIWTPSGEHVPRPEPEGPTASGGAPEEELEGEGYEEYEAALAQARAELAATPVADIVANHAIGLWQLAVLHLGLDRPGEEPAKPNLSEARLAIDAMAALVEGLGEALGDHHKPLVDALAQLRLAFVQVSSAQ
jgi:uncharacterized protein DUF1844